ncbi:Glycosyl transferase family 4 [Pedobacter nyackensis]|uniref:Glycosyl transferase family 4 n=2 Tax=Pedobacter nyackensis TaxID=475255 RepID=A0A1W2C2V2_9SPHI|nr:Glycosyl transferase family 4 [Pedobacter nyackensis]
MTTPVQEQYLLYYAIIGISSIFITWLSIPCSIEVSQIKIQPISIPRREGVAIFIPTPLLLWSFNSPMLLDNYLLTACVILFAIGVNDDLPCIYDIKLFITCIASLILITPGNIRLYKLQDAFGFYELPFLPSVTLSVLIIMFLINAFNRIDRINSLAATTGIMVSSSFSALFIHLHQYELAAVSIVLVGAISDFIKSKLAQPEYAWVFASQAILCSR